MQHSESVSKGYFVYMPEKKITKGKKRSKKDLQDPLSVLYNTGWYCGFHRVWNSIEEKLKTIGDDVMSVLLNDIVNFIQGTPMKPHLIPTVLLLTGVNLPDHCSLFNRLKDQLRNTVSSHVAMLSSRDCLNIKQTVEQIVAQFINKSAKLSKGKKKGKASNGNLHNKGRKKSTGFSTSESDMELGNDYEIDSDTDLEMDIDNDDNPPTSGIIKKSDCTMPFLAEWYKDKINNSPTKNIKKLVIVLKDFEGFQQHVLHKLILILSGYLDQLPIVLLFGVATTESAIGESLTHQIISKLELKVFQSQPSVYFLNNTLDKVFLTPECPFQLTGKLLKFFTDVFLFYDFSVHQFTQGIKYCVMDHYFENDIIGLFCQEENTVLNDFKNLEFTKSDYLGTIPSIKECLEDLDDSDIPSKNTIMPILSMLRRTITEFYSCLRILHIFVKDLPQSPLGKQFRELYCVAMCKDISKTSGYKECQQLLNFSSKNDLEKKLLQVQNIVSNSDLQLFKPVKTIVNKFKGELENIGLKKNTRSPVKSPMKIDLNVKNRSQLKQRLAEISVQPQIKVGYEALREKIVSYFMNSFLPGNLLPYPDRTQLWETVLVSDIDARNRVVPRIRAPIHTALNNPHHYLQCDCCEITDEGSILPTMPDVCIAYKLHLESGPLINIYDWLQSFSMIVDSSSEKKNIEDVDEQVQARFTQAVAELEFLGFIKSSKKKPDHVNRLTWGGTSSSS